VESNLFGDVKFPIKRKRCGNAMDIKISDLEKNPEIKCPNCGSITKMIADDLEKWRQNIIREVDKFTENHSATQ